MCVFSRLNDPVSYGLARNRGDPDLGDEVELYEKHIQ